MDIGSRIRTSASSRPAVFLRAYYFGPDSLAGAKLAAIADYDAVALGKAGEDFDARIIFEPELHMAFLKNVLGIDGEYGGIVAVADYCFQRDSERVCFLAQQDLGLRKHSWH